MAQAESATFAVGDRVTRPADVFDRRSPLMHGSVSRLYTMLGYPELYEVEWDDGSVARGYLPHGLDPENYVRRGWFWRGVMRREVMTCKRCGSVVLAIDVGLHDQWHDFIDRVESDAFQGGGLIG